MDSATNFFESIWLGDSETWLEDLFHAELPDIATRVQGSQNYVPHVCPLADIGEYILRVLQIHSQFANYLIHSNLIPNHISSKSATLVDEDDGSSTDYLDEKFQALK